MEWSKRILDPRRLIGDTTAVDWPAAVEALLDRQEAAWPQLREADIAWFGTRYRELVPGWYSIRLQYNPSRTASVSAPVDPESIRRRPCFLCAAHMPPTEQGLAVEADYGLFFNPFPIFYPHPVVAARDHTPQAIAASLGPFLRTARTLAPRYALLYNGPRCGASAPDHLHFQAFPRYATPIEIDLWHARHRRSAAHRLERLLGSADGELALIRDYGRTVLVLRAADPAGLERHLRRILDALRERESDPDHEPMINLLAWFEDGTWTLCLFPRRRHRPAAYGTDGPGSILVSPGSVDLAGIIVTPRETDFETLDAAAIRTIFDEVCVPESELRSLLAPLGVRAHRATTAVTVPAGEPVVTERRVGEPLLRVGLMEGREQVAFRLVGRWRFGTTSLGSGEYRAVETGGGIRLTGPAGELPGNGGPLRLVPLDTASDRFVVHGVTIGVDFHWQRDLELTYNGTLELRSDGAGRLSVINEVALESYLTSVIASEMRGDAPAAFLRAHAVISRSWVLAQLTARDGGGVFFPPEHLRQRGGRLGWTDRARHATFDVCADDHCQRYQGIGRAANPGVAAAVAATRGLVLTDGDGVADARFSKCCGGVSETFGTAWADIHLPGLEAVRDAAEPGGWPQPLTLEAHARSWITGRPAAWCDIRDPEVLARILPDFDRETGCFYRWELTVDGGELTELIHRKTGWDPGRLLKIVPLQRGFSGRLVRVLLRGTAGRLLLGKELEIRRALSPTHLYSSAFVVETVGGSEGPPAAFRFRGAGWGHGVGLCQIGAAGMAVAGHDHDVILAHYFRNLRLERLY